MAGGRGERMRASGVAVPKPLVLVRGTPLVEHNLLQLLRHGFDDVVVSVPGAGGACRRGWPARGGGGGGRRRARAAGWEGPARGARRGVRPARWAGGCAGGGGARVAEEALALPPRSGR